MSRTISELITKFTGPATSEPGVSRERYQVSDRDGRFVQLTGKDAEEVARVLVADMGIIYARCPGCGDRADAAHMSACVVLKRDKMRMEGWLAGAMHVIGMVRVQLGRRGSVELDKLVEAVEALYVNEDDGSLGLYRRR